MATGINIFLAGFVPTENMRFRDEALSFKVVEIIEEEKSAGKRATRCVAQSTQSTPLCLLLVSLPLYLSACISKVNLSYPPLS
jgi:hypothetical protein